MRKKDGHIQAKDSIHSNLWAEYFYPPEIDHSYDSICMRMDQVNITYIDLVFHVPYPQVIQ